MPIQEEEFFWYRYLNNKKICCGYELKWFGSGSNSHNRYQTKIWILFFKNFRISTMNLYWNLTILTRKQCWPVPVYADNNVSLSLFYAELPGEKFCPVLWCPQREHPARTQPTPQGLTILFLVPLFVYLFFWLRDRFLSLPEIFYIITQWSCRASGSVDEILNFTPSLNIPPNLNFPPN